jgi:hypothetical protein
MSLDRPGVALLASVLGACGLVSHEVSSTPVPSDGIGNFGDSAPVELCLGTASVIAPAVAVGAGAAVCVPTGGGAVACETAASCSGIEQCICGRCIVEACSGFCSAGLVCRGNRCTTACVLDSDCAAGEQCASGGCARTCDADAQCHFGEQCDTLNNVCATQTCSAAVPCAPGDTCEQEQVLGELHEPDVLSLGGGTVAFAELRTEVAGAVTSSIVRASVSSLEAWAAAPVTPVLAPAAGQSRVGAPSVLAGGAGLDLYFAVGDGAGIAHASSTDGGVTFSRDPGFVLQPAEPWENGWVGSPGAVVFGGETYLFYEGGPGAGIGLARVGPGGATRVGTAPVITPAMAEDPIFWRDVTQVGAPFALVDGPVLRLYFTGRGAWGSDAIVEGVTVPAEVNDAIGLFTTRDLQTFEPYPTGPVYARVTNLRSYLGEREAVVRLLPAGAEITFVSSDASGQNVTGLAAAGP